MGDVALTEKSLLGGLFLVAKNKYDEWLTEEGLVLIGGWARDGLSKEQIAENMGICRDTLYEWEKKFTDISDALKKGREVADRNVENALYKNAMNGNIAAQIFWLKNRKPNEWKDKQNMDLGGEGKVIIIDSIPDS